MRELLRVLVAIKDKKIDGGVVVSLWMGLIPRIRKILLGKLLVDL